MPDSRRRFFRDAPWLTASRAQGWCICLAVISAMVVAATVIAAPHGVTASGTLLAPDFVTFYGAASFLPDHAAAAYDHAAFAARLRALLPHALPGDYALLYPPSFLLLCLGLAALPYLPAATLWLGATFLLLLAALRPLLRFPFGMVAAITAPAVLMNASNGQNAFVTGACVAAAMAAGDGAPALAGLCLGALAVKPQLAVLIPVTLVLGRKWRTLAATAASAAVICAASALLFGVDSWRAWLAAAPLSRTILEHGYNGYQNMLSVFAAARLLHAGVPAAYAVQGLMLALMLGLLGATLRRATSLRATIALTAIATLLATPWSLDYDLVILAAPLAWLAGTAIANGWAPYEKLILLATYALPLLSRNIAADTHVAIAPPVLLLLLAATLRRTREKPDCGRTIADGQSMA